MKVKDNNSFDTQGFVKIITEAFPYIQRLRGEVIVVKCSGRVTDDPDLLKSLARDIALLHQIGISLVLVHGGGKQISRMLERVGIESRFQEGMRITDDETMEIVEMVLVGNINSAIVSLINTHNGGAIGISGCDDNFIHSRKLTGMKLVKGDGSDAAHVDLGRVGEIVDINVDLLHDLLTSAHIPVVAPIGFGDDGVSYNINADVVASRLAVALQCNKFVVLTDTPGVLDKQNRLLTSLTLTDVRNLINDGIISGGMIPKLESATAAIEGGVVSVQIIDGRQPHSLLLELFSDTGIGSLIRA